jgi:hypothetical protein
MCLAEETNPGMSSLIQTLSPEQIESFIGSLPYTVIHLDGTWDGCRQILEKTMLKVAAETQETGFGYIDVDECQDHARAIGLTNVPACCYYWGRELVATVIGMRQDIAANLELIRVGKVPDMSNRMSNK